MFVLICCVLNCFAGVSGFVAFLILGNNPASVWAIIAGILSIYNTHLRWLEFKKRLDEWYGEKELLTISNCGFVGFTIGVMGIVYHTTIEVLLKKSILPINESEVIRIVWAFMTAKGGIFLMYTARSFSKANEDEEICTNGEHTANDNIHFVE